MTVRDLFYFTNTYSRDVVIYDCDRNIIYEKKRFIPIGKFPYWDSHVSWIFFITGDRIEITII